MKFRILVSILTFALLALFIISIFLAMRLRASIANEKEITKTLKISESELAKKNADLEKVMKELHVWESTDQEERQNELEKGEFKLGLAVQANNENFHNLIAFAIGSGFKLDYANQERGGISGNPVVYYYSEKGKKVAETFKSELEKEFDRLAPFKVEKALSAGDANKITAKLRFR